MKSPRIFGKEWLVGYVVFVTFVSLIVAATVHVLPAVSVFLGALGLINLLGWEKIPADPPNRALLMHFGKRIPELIDEGWRFLFPGVYTLVLVPFGIWTLKLPDQLVLTPDMATVKVPVTIIGQVDAGESIPEHEQGQALILYKNAGGEEGVQEIIIVKAAKALRKWGANLEVNKGTVEEPDWHEGIWEDAVRSGDEAAKKIAENICGHSLTPDEMSTFEGENGFLRMIDFGVRIHGVEIGEIESTGDLAEAAGQKAKERRDRMAEEIELEHIRKQVGLLEDVGFTTESATELIQTERKKVTKVIDQKQLSIPAETRGIIEDILVSTLRPKRRRWLPWR